MFEIVVSWLGEPRFASGQQDGNDRQVVAKLLLPSEEGSRAAARVWQAEQRQTSIVEGGSARKPRGIHETVSDGGGLALLEKACLETRSRVK